MFRAAASFPLATLRRMRQAGRVALACSTLALLSACGGGDRAEPYKPDRIVVFGDENSAFAPDEAVGTGYIKGLVYTTNSVSFLTRRYCNDKSNPTAACVLDVTPPAISDEVSGTVDEATFQVDDGNRPFGTGAFIASGEFTIVRLVANGDATVTPPGNPPPTPNPNTPLKRDMTVAYSCSVNLTAVQRIAHTFGKGFNEKCPSDAAGAYTHAVLGAKVSTLQQQVNDALAAGQLGKGSLVVVWIGHNDITEVTDSTTYNTQRAKSLEVKARANQLAQIVIQIMRTGAKVAVIGVANVGYSPWATGNGFLTPPPSLTSCDGKTRSACAVQLVAEFNQTLKLGDPDDTGYKGLQDYTFRGREYTFVEGGGITDSLVSNTAYVNDMLCPINGVTTGTPSVKPDGTIPLPDTLGNFQVQYCSGLSLRGDSTTWLWADQFRPSPVIHQTIANAVLTRVVNQF